MPRDVHCATAAFYGALELSHPMSVRGLLAAGRLWQRIHLEATAIGLAMQP